MSNFEKRFVRVEWLAFQTAVDLMREVGWGKEYFLSSSHLMGDRGYAPTMSAGEGSSVDEFGLQEIENFGPHPNPDISHGELFQEMNSYFIKRTYHFVICKTGERSSLWSIWISYTKQTKEDDWNLVHEVVIDQTKQGAERWVIDRSKRESENFPRKEVLHGAS